MRIEQTSISCGVRRLVIDKNEKPSKEEIGKLITANKNGCAIVITGVPARNKDVIKALLDNDFERVKKTGYIVDNSVKDNLAEMAFFIMYHDHEYDLDTIEDDASRFEQFMGATVSSGLIDLASLVIHHGQPPVGTIKFFIRYMDK